MGASKKLAASKAEKAASATDRKSTLDGLYAVGGSIARACTDGVVDGEREEIAEQLLNLYNDIGSSLPKAEFLEVVRGALAALGYEVKNIGS
ncbi:hypothetical protein [Janthinobacterium kumbetense]|uniref:Uncharacterized protein n=1 Tax=Janthinobacterium kumbetense TaxID=2950280 RepID=A0ABT0WM55_9BURK|nr:hypothetical protein [Janthinobacterium kumbetense]MCM2564809.1 hypothetical protein [Janthinobacterium kumbetense]